MKSLSKSWLSGLLGLLILIPAVCQADGYRLPSYQSTVLKNGLTVVLMEQHEVPLIDVRVAIRGGAMVDGDQSGLSHLTAQSLLFGAGDRNKQELDHQFDFIGASVSASANRDHSQMRASFAVRDLDTMLPILGELLLDPTFDADEFAKFQKRTLAQLGQQKESPRSVISNYYHNLMLGDHPYASVPEGDAETIEGFTRDDLAQFHKDWYQPQNAILCVVGDFSTVDMLARLDTMFGAWKKGDAVVPAVGPISTPTEAQVLLVDKSDASESTFYIGGPGV
ncbi:MAG: zinc protease, partial [Candidatus Krumholzibacteriia bacterium]